MNKDIIIKVLSNKIIKRIIYDYVQWIHRYIERKKAEQLFTWYQLISMPYVLTQYGYFDLIKKYCSKRMSLLSISDIDSSIIQAIKFNRLDILRYLIEVIPTVADKSTNTTAVYQYLISGFDYMYYASYFGTINIVEYLESLTQKVGQDIKWNYRIAFEHSSTLDVCKWFHNRLPNEIQSNPILCCRLFDNSTKSGDILYVEWLIKLLTNNRKKRINCKCFSHTVVENAVLGGYHMLFYIFNQKQWFDGFLTQHTMRTTVFKNAIPSGDTRIMKLLINHGVPIDERIIAIKCIQSGTSDTIKWLHCNLPLENSMMTDPRDARSTNNLYQIQPSLPRGNDPLFWFYMTASKSRPPNTNLMDYIVQCGNLDIINWMHQNDDKLQYCGSIHSLDSAIYTRNFRVLEWFTTNNRTESFSPDLFKFTDHPLRWWLINNRPRSECPANLLETFMLDHHFEMAEWLIENRPECCNNFNSLSSQIAIQNHRFHLIKWMHQHRKFNLPPRVLREAFISNDIELIKWINENRTERIQHPFDQSTFNLLSQQVQTFIYEEFSNLI